MGTTSKKITEEVSINNEQQLYVLKCGSDGFTCLGFGICKDRSDRLAKELGEPIKSIPIGTIEAYREYERLIEIVRDRNQRTGFRSQSELVPELIGLEGWRVKVVDCLGDVRNFTVGKSTGYIPCHLEIKSKRSHGGEKVIGLPFKSVEKLYYSR